MSTWSKQQISRCEYKQNPEHLGVQCCEAYNSRGVIKSSFEETLVQVWRPTVAENATVVELGGSRYPVRRAPKRGLRQVDFVFDGNEIRGLEQNPDARSEWAKLARSGKKVMQLLSGGRYVAVVVDGKAKLYDDWGL